MLIYCTIQKRTTQVQTPAQIAAATAAAAAATAAASATSASATAAAAAKAAAVPVLSTNPTTAATGTPDNSAGNQAASAAAQSTTISNLPNQAAIGSFVGQQAIAAQQQTNQQTIETSNFQAAQALAKSNLDVQQAEEQAQQTTAEQNAYAAENQQVQGAEEQIGSTKTQAKSQYSTLVSNYAARGIKVGAGVSSEPDTSSVSSDANGQLSITPGSASKSPLAQLVAYQSNANLQIANQATNLANADALATGEIKSGTAAFETAMSDQLAEFNAQQAQDLSQFNTALLFNQNAFNENQIQALAAYQQGNTFDQNNAQMSLSAMASADSLAEQFTQQNLESYDTSLWLNAFSSILNKGASLASNIQPWQSPQPTVAATWNGDTWGLSGDEPMSGSGY